VLQTPKNQVRPSQSEERFAGKRFAGACDPEGPVLGANVAGESFARESFARESFAECGPEAQRVAIAFEPSVVPLVAAPPGSCSFVPSHYSSKKQVSCRVLKRIVCVVLD
jgi:hypothetical protein